ncbi:hypothetical protein IT575_12180 [bacterium]|nr:hypothetical protein [bacterium]
MVNDVHPIVPCLTRLRRFLLNQDLASGTALGAMPEPKPNRHSLPFANPASVTIGLGNRSGEAPQRITLIPQVETVEDKISGGEILILLISDKVREDDATTSLLNLSHQIRHQIRRAWNLIGGDIAIAGGITESKPFIDSGQSPDGRQLPPLQMVAISIPVRSVSNS